MKLKTIKCKNQQCLLNDNLKCGSPYRNREDFSCLNINVDKPISKETIETNKILKNQWWRESVGLRQRYRGE